MTVHGRDLIFYPGIKRAAAGPQLQSALRNGTQTAPLGIAWFHECPDEILGGAAASFGDNPGITVDEEWLSLCLFADDNGQRSEELASREASSNSRNSMGMDQLFRQSCAGDGADMAGIEVGVTGISHGEIGLIHGLVGRQQREIRESLRHGPLDRQAGGRSRGFKADRQEDNGFLRMPGGIGHGIERRINNLNLGTGGPGFAEILGGARYPDQIAKGADRHLFLDSQPDCFVDEIRLSDTDRTTRSRDEFNIFWQELTDAQTKYFVGMCAANFHDA